MIGTPLSRSLLQLLLAVTLSTLLLAQAQKPERKVQGNTITSRRDPSVRIELPKSAQYAGADRWILYDIADCELHAFVDADARKNVQRLYWIQFEAYVPSRPELHHTYDSPRHTEIGGLDFYVDTWVRKADDPVKKGSDSEHIATLIRAKGYNMPGAMMSVRLVHLLDEQKRKELMIIYSEDLAGTGFTAAQLDQGGSAHNQWPAIEKGLIERARQKIRIEPARMR